MRLALFALLVALPVSVAAQTNADAPLDAAVEPAPVSAESDPVWVAGISGGYLDRHSGPNSPYATASLTRYAGKTYLRGGVTYYKSTLQQPDASLPSTFLIGSLGFGGNWDGWVVDVYGSVGRQKFGQVVTDLGPRDSMAGSGSAYFAGGIRAGRIVRLNQVSTLAVTGSLQYLTTRSLRHVISPSGPQDVQIPDQAFSGSAALRYDRSFGEGNKHAFGLSLEHFESNNGSTVTVVTPATSGPTGPAPPGAISTAIGAQRTPDRWEEASVSATFQLKKSLWLDLEAKRSFGAVAGDSVSSTAGLRWRF